MGHDLTDSLNRLIRQLADTFAEALIERVKPEMERLLADRPYRVESSPTIQPSRMRHKGNLWSLDELAEDSGITKGAWYKWVNQRRIPVVRLGRSIRVRDEDYRRFIQDSLRPAVKLMRD
jgi:excisionase family DNA binding protein